VDRGSVKRLVLVLYCSFDKRRSRLAFSSFCAGAAVPLAGTLSSTTSRRLSVFRRRDCVRVCYSGRLFGAMALCLCWPRWHILRHGHARRSRRYLDMGRDNAMVESGRDQSWAWCVPTPVLFSLSVLTSFYSHLATKPKIHNVI
jgi:hypothetical protein